LEKSEGKNKSHTTESDLRRKNVTSILKENFTKSGAKKVGNLGSDMHVLRGTQF